MEFEAIKRLAGEFENTDPLKGRVSHKFLVDEIYRWLQEKLEAKRNDMLPDHIKERCTTEIKDYEIWIPVYRTYSAQEFAIGDVNFRPVSKSILDQWYGRIPEDALRSPGVAEKVNRQRAEIQGSIAACAKVNAEVQKASEIVQLAANETIALLRFLSPVNWTCRIVSHCLPVGRENTQRTFELFVEHGAIQSMQQASIEDGPSGWNIDEARHKTPGLLEALHELASRREATQFMISLYDALQVYSGRSIAVETSHKIIFVVAAIESMLLKDRQEPIQNNLGERMAFLAGNTLEERKAIVKNVRDFYRVRSAFVHHGQAVSPEDRRVVDTFFFNVWFVFSRFLTQLDRYKTKQELLAALDDAKLA